MTLQTQSTRKKKGKGKDSKTKVEGATTIQLVEINKKEGGRIRENAHTKITKEIILQVEEEIVVENLTSHSLLLITNNKIWPVKKYL